jgi:hypothetical protein
MDMPMDMNMDMSGSGWHLMQDGSLSLIVNHQGGARGGDELKAPNWWMGMATRRVGGGDLTLTGMLSLDPATVGEGGYRELFQVGEAVDGKPIVDHQHPHDLWMQIAASWRTTVRGTGITVAGGPAGEPALGPVSFMHRASSAAIPLAPLVHHTFDSTHIAFGVATVGVDRGRVAVEASLFNGREPDQRRWDFDFGRMDSVSARVWYRPAPGWELQASSGRLVDPEELHHGNIVRTTASASYFAGDDAHMIAATVGVGMNHTDETTRHAAFGELTRVWGRTTGSARLELVQVESDLLRFAALPETPDSEARRDLIGALTLGALREIAQVKKASAAIGAAVTVYAVPDRLRPEYGRRPLSFQVFVQLRPPTGGMGRMWNMRMAAPPPERDAGMQHHMP